MAAEMRLNIQYVARDGKSIPIITDDRGYEVPNLVAIQISTRVNEPSHVTLELLVDDDNITLGTGHANAHNIQLHNN